MPPSSWENRCCDLVMKGGVTSGILYPTAVTRIAEGFTLKAIGGTSAGAIGACLAAAAEYQRRVSGGMEGFRLLEGVSQEMGEPGRLFDLFRPDRETKKLYTFMLKGLAAKDKGWVGKKWFTLRLAGKVVRGKRTSDRWLPMAMVYARGWPTRTRLLLDMARF